MTKLAGLCAGLALSFALSAPAFAEGETAETVVATVNGTPVTLGQMIALRESLPQQYLTLPDDVLFTGILDQLVQQEVLAQSVTALSTRDKANIDNNRRGYLSGVALTEVASGAVTDAALQAAWDAKYGSAPAEKEYNAAHILVKTEDEAKKIVADLEAGGDFAELAKQNSTDPGSGANGGDLGWFKTAMMVPSFGEAVAAAELGKVTAPVESQFGWHIILVKEVRDAPKPTLDEVRDELAGEIEAAAVEAHVKTLESAAAVEKPGAGLDPAILKNNALID